MVTGTSAFSAVQWALGAIMFEDNVAGKATAEVKSDPLGCLSKMNKDVMFYYRRQMRCATIRSQRRCVALQQAASCCAQGNSVCAIV